MTFRELTVLLIIYFSLTPIKLKELENKEFYNENYLKLRSNYSKIIYFFNWFIIIFYFLSCLLYITVPGLL